VQLQPTAAAPAVLELAQGQITAIVLGLPT